MIGKCLCGAVEFEVAGEMPNLYQCHCSLCRKTTGAAANAATFIEQTHFEWLSGESSIRSYVKDSGFRSDFCGCCGSPVPNLLRDTGLYFLPVGLLEETKGFQVVQHLYTDSKAHWDVIAGSAEQHDEMPSLKALNEALQHSSSVS